MKFRIRDAVAGDAADAAMIMRHSIEGLCAADHKNDETLLNQWTASKTESEVRKWIQNPANWSKIACRRNEAIGIAMLSGDGEVLLMYVTPDAVGYGVGSGLLAALEETAAQAGLSELRLESTITAKSFYQRNGFSESGQPSYEDSGMPAYPMTKQVP